MSASSDIQAAIAAILQEPGALSAGVPVLKRITGNIESDIEAAAGKMTGLCVYVLPVLPMAANACQGADFVFFDRAEVRVRIIEMPAVNQTGVDAYELIDDICTALHWQPKDDGGAPLVGLLSHPLQLAEKPVEAVEGIIEESEQMVRIVDVVFAAVYGFEKRTLTAP